MSPFPSGAFSSLLLPRTRGGESPLPDLLLHAPPYLYSPFPLSPPGGVRGRSFEAYLDICHLILVLVISWVSNTRTSQGWVPRREVHRGPKRSRQGRLVIQGPGSRVLRGGDRGRWC